MSQSCQFFHWKPTVGISCVPVSIRRLSVSSTELSPILTVHRIRKYIKLFTQYNPSQISLNPLAKKLPREH